MSTTTKKKVRPIEQFSRFDIVPGVDFGTDGVILVRTGNGYLVWFPGHSGWAPMSQSRYDPVSLHWIYQVAAGQWRYPEIAGSGRFNKARYEELLPKICEHMGMDITIEDIDVSRRRFTTVFN